MQFRVLSPAAKMYAIERDVVGFWGKARRIIVAFATRPSIVQASQQQLNGVLIVNRGHYRATPLPRQNDRWPPWCPRARDSHTRRAAGRERSSGRARAGQIG